MSDRETLIRDLDTAYHALASHEADHPDVSAALDAITAIILVVCPDEEEFVRLTRDQANARDRRS